MNENHWIYNKTPLSVILYGRISLNNITCSFTYDRNDYAAETSSFPHDTTLSIITNRISHTNNQPQI